MALEFMLDGGGADATARELLVCVCVCGGTAVAITLDFFGKKKGNGRKIKDQFRSKQSQFR